MPQTATDKQREMSEAHTSICLLRHCLIFHMSLTVILTYTGTISNQHFKTKILYVLKHEQFEHVAKKCLPLS